MRVHFKKEQGDCTGSIPYVTEMSICDGSDMFSFVIYPVRHLNKYRISHTKKKKRSRTLGFVLVHWLHTIVLNLLNYLLYFLLRYSVHVHQLHLSY